MPVVLLANMVWPALFIATAAAALVTVWVKQPAF